MSDRLAKIRISLSEGVLEVEGGEDFVASQVASLQSVIRDAFVAPRAKPRTKEDSVGEASPSGGSDLSAFSAVFAEADNKVQILKDLPGGNKAGKTVSAALLLCFANNLSGRPTTQWGEIREVCSAHACLDSSNFSSALKGAKEHLLISGSGANKSVKLTVPGEKRAREIAQQLNV
ncbi:MAG: hypothetical protein V4558_13860 [Gemmatimonadota bacterium]